MEGSKIVVKEEINHENPITTTDGRPPNPFAPASRNCFTASYKKSLVRHPSLVMFILCTCIYMSFLFALMPKRLHFDLWVLLIMLFAGVYC